MLFSSVAFLYGYLPVVLLAYYLAPRRAKNAVLLLASLVFYFYGERAYTLLLVFSSLSDYAHSLYIEKYRGTPRARRALVSSVVINLGMLGFFKYTDFLLLTANALFGTRFSPTGIPLPIGISFFTFQTMSYTIDVYRGRVHAQRSLVDLATFVCLFPQLVAGPIVRYTDVDAALKSRRVTLETAAVGVRRFAVGLGKKVLLANSLAALGTAFRASEGQSVLFYWIYALSFTLQIYFDFSGYSDMAIGLGALFGFRFPENFDHPFVSRSIAEFWRRWHMTLGGWFRDYLYIPLGGNRVTGGRWIFNTLLVWFLTGLWHGAAWNFVLWGVYFGVLLILEKAFLARVWDALGVFRRVPVLFLLLVSFVLFNADGLAGARADLAGLFGLTGLPAVSLETLYHLRSAAVLLGVSLVGATPLVRNAARRLERSRAGAAALTVLEPAAVALLLLVSTASLISGSFNPFLYFRF